MNAIPRMGLGLVFALVGWSCAAQEASISSAALPNAPQLQAQLLPPPVELSSLYSSSIVPEGSAAVTLMPMRTAAPARIINSKFVLANGLHVGMMIFDVEMTQRCIASHHCREGNPLMPSSHAGQLAVGFGFATYGSSLSYWLKKHKSKQWWIPPAGGTLSHTVGVASGLMHQ